MEATNKGLTTTDNSSIIGGSTEITPVGLKTDFGENHLGQEGQNFVDHLNLPTHDGFVIKVSQTSTGVRAIEAESKDPDKTSIAVLRKTESGNVWEEATRKWGKKVEDVEIHTDWGNMDKLGGTNMAEIASKLGNPGANFGLIRMTDKETKENKFFAIGVNFKGKADDWNVQAAYFEVEFVQNPNLASSSQKSLGESTSH